MECPTCAKEIAPDRLFCTWCESYVPDPAAGEKASIPRRFAAAVIDPFLVGAAIFGPPILLGGTFGAVFGPGLGRSLGVLTAVVAALAVVYLMLKLFARGQTPGKYLLAEQVVEKRGGRPPGFMKMLVRETFGKFISGLFFGLGWFWAIWDKDQQAWHDKIAGTVVVRRRSVETDVVRAVAGVEVIEHAN